VDRLRCCQHRCTLSMINWWSTVTSLSHVNVYICVQCRHRVMCVCLWQQRLASWVVLHVRLIKGVMKKYFYWWHLSMEFLYYYLLISSYGLQFRWWNNSLFWFDVFWCHFLKQFKLTWLVFWHVYLVYIYSQFIAFRNSLEEIIEPKCSS